jgi:hypothetical protein
MMQRFRWLFSALAIVALSAAPIGRLAAQPGCIIPSDQHVLIAVEPLEMVPGERRVLELAMVRMPYTPSEPLPTGCRARWSLSAGAHGRIDRRGTLRVARDARPGDQLVVNVAVGGRTVRQEVHVIDPRPNPIVGTWAQSGPARCAGGEDAPSGPVRELILRRDGRFSLTYMPFETYKDFWGTYTYDRNSGAIAIAPTGGNRDPAGLDLAGTALVAERRLTLSDVWLGQPGQATPRTCTYVFVQ